MAAHLRAYSRSRERYKRDLLVDRGSEQECEFAHGSITNVNVDEGATILALFTRAVEGKGSEQECESAHGSLTNVNVDAGATIFVHFGALPTRNAIKH